MGVTDGDSIESVLNTLIVGWFKLGGIWSAKVTPLGRYELVC